MEKNVSGNSQPREITQPILLPVLVRGDQIRNGPFVVNVTDDMVSRREKENREIIRRWQEADLRRNMMQEQDEYYGAFAELKVRRQFIFKVFTILSLQLIFTAFVIASFIFIEEVRNVMVLYPMFWMIALGVFLLTYVSISCCSCARKKKPINIICLIFLTVSLAYLTATISVFYTIQTVLITVISTALVTIVICFIAAGTKFDLTKNTGIVLIVSLVAVLGLVGMSIAFYFTQIKILHIGIGVIGTLLISLYLFYDLQMIMGGRTIEISPDEVIYATTQLYVDIMMLYRYLLMLVGLSE